MKEGNNSLALSEKQYTDIEAAVMGSERGRTFLREFCTRNRHANTVMLLEAISRLESALCLKTTAAAHEQPGEITPALVEIASVTSAARTEITAMRNDMIRGGGALTQGAETFSAAIAEARSLSADLLSLVGTIEDLVWQIRENGNDNDDALFDQLKAEVEELMALCWRQDVSERRAVKALDTLQLISEQVGGTLPGTLNSAQNNEAGFATMSGHDSMASEDTSYSIYFGADSHLLSVEGSINRANNPVRLANAPDEQNIAPNEETSGQINGEPQTAPYENSAQANLSEASSAEPDAELDDDNGHIIIIRTPSDPLGEKIPEPTSRREEA